MKLSKMEWGWIVALILVLLFLILTSQKSPEYEIKWIRGHEYIITNNGSICHAADCQGVEHYESDE